MINIGVDLVSGETDLGILMQGCFDALREAEDIRVVLAGKKELYEPYLRAARDTGNKLVKKGPTDADLLHRISIIDATDTVTMDDDPLLVVKKKKNSGLMKALRAHKNQEIDAFFSPGNTGAIVVAASLVMGRAPNVKKPGLATFLPSLGETPNLMLDVGASAECEVKDLQRFAVMGRIYAREMLCIPNPRVGLLNIGSESHKGTALMKSTYKALLGMDINFVGNVEGNEVLADKADVIVCTGLLGNITLKVAEGAAKTMFTLLKSSIKENTVAKLSVPLYKNALMRLKDHTDSEKHGGAPLLGVWGNIFIGHGSSGREAIKNGILKAAEAVRHDVIGKIHHRMEELRL